MAFSVFRRVLLRKGSAGIHPCPGGGHRIISSSSTTTGIDNSNNNNWNEPRSRILSPWLMLGPSCDDESGGRGVAYNFHSLASKQRMSIPCRNKSSGDLEFVGSSHGWLALYDRRNKDLCLSSPITGRRIKLPSLLTLPDPLINSEGGVSRVTISCSPDENNDSCRVMMAVGRVRRLAFCAVPGTEWTLLGKPYCERKNVITRSREVAPREYEDVVYSSRHKLFFCITRCGTELESWNVGDPLSPRTEWSVLHDDELDFNNPDYPWPCQPKQKCWHLKYLMFAEQRDELFLVVRHVNPRINYQTIGFDVYKVDRHERRGVLRHMKGCLEGLAMFVGISESRAVCASEFPELEPNSIYFCDENRLMMLSRSFANKGFGGHDNGIFNYEAKTFSSCCDGCVLNPLDYDCVKRIDPPPLWFTPPPNSLHL